MDIDGYGYRWIWMDILWYTIGSVIHQQSKTLYINVHNILCNIVIYCVCCVSVHRVISHQIGRSWHRCRAARSACPFSTREDGLKPCDEAISVCWMTLCCACLGSSDHISEITEIFWNHQSLSSQKKSSTDLNTSHQNILFQRWKYSKSQRKHSGPSSASHQAAPPAASVRHPAGPAWRV